MQPEQENLIRSQLRLSPNVKLAAAELQLSEKINVRQEETKGKLFYLHFFIYLINQNY